MSTRLLIPLVSTNAADVTLTHWKARPGDPVSQGQIVLEVTTDKAAFEIESPAAGTLLAVLAPERSVVPIGYAVALIGQPGEGDAEIERDNAALVAAQQYALVAREPPAGPEEPLAAPVYRPSSPAPAPAAESSIRATPKARRLAAEHGLDLKRIRDETGATILTESSLKPYLP